jgi:hypothetical protein
MSKMFIDLTIDATDPDFEEITNAGWNKYVTGTVLI